MPRNKAKGSPVSSDDDSISLTSTAPSEPKDEYLIEGILAEREEDGTTRYLVKWEGYPDERCTWEPASSFQDEQTFHDWQNRKMRTNRGLETPYNVSALEMRVEDWLEASEKRKARRRAKKIRLGLPLDPGIEEGNSDHTSSEALEEDHSESDRPSKKRRGSSPPAARAKSRPDKGVTGSSKSNSRLDPSPQWTPKEEAALKHGLELLKGPYWEEILGFFGPTGTISQDLRDRDALDVEAKTLKLKIDYVKSGRDVPQYLQFADSETKHRTLGKLECVERNNEDSDSSSTEDSLMEELQQATVKGLQRRSKKPNDNFNGVQQSKPSAQEPKRQISGRTSHPEKRNPVVVPKLRVSTAQMIPRVEPAKKVIPNQKNNQMGSVGRGPLRMALGDRKLKSAGKKPNVSGAAILGNWDASVRPRGKQLPLKNAASAVDKPAERFGKLSTKRRYERASRNERAPDFDSLTLRNPKEFDVVRKPSVSSPVTKVSTKPPFELYRESLAEGKEEPTPVEASISTSTFDVVESSSNIFDQGEQTFQSASRTTPNTRTIAHPTPKFPAQSTFRDSSRFVCVPYDAYDPYQIIATIKLGPDRIDQGTVRCRGLVPYARRLLLGLKSGPRELFVWFKQSVTAEDYKAYFHTESGVVSGYIAPFPQAEGNINRMAETLKMHVSGGLFMTKEFSMLVYPSGSEDWTFLDEKLPIYPPDAVLRFVIRSPFPDLMEGEVRKPLPGSTEQDSRNLLPDLTEEESLPSQTEIVPVVSIRDGESNINAVFRSFYDVEYSRLVAPTTLGKTTEMYNFFLIFPLSKETERDLVIEFLQHNKAHEIFSYKMKGAWNYFSTRINAGVIIIHEDFSDLWRIPNLARVLRKNINVWNFNMTPSQLALDRHLNRLFPHGAAVLLTDGLFLHQPHEAARILTWFRLIILKSKAPRTWKLCTRPRLKDWLLTVQADRNMEDGKVYVQCYGEVWRILKEEYMEECLLEEEQPTSEAPMCFMGEVPAFDESVGKGVAANDEVDKDAIAQNDKVLLEWFAGYAMTKLEHFRRFDIVTGDERHQELMDKYQSRWSHIEIVTVEDLYCKHKVPDWDVLEREEEKRAKSMRRRWAEEDTASAEAERLKVVMGR